MLKDAVDLAAVKRVLVIKLRHHGDVLVTSPVFSVLKAHAPHAEIDALVYSDTADMVTFHPAVVRVFGVERGARGWRALKEGWRLWRELRARRYDLLIHLTENPRGAVLARLLAPRYRVARDFPGRRGRAWRGSFTHLYKLPTTPRHIVEQHLDALRRIGIRPEREERGLTLVPGADAEGVIDARLAQHDLPVRGFVVFHPTSRWLFKCWREDRCAALIDTLTRTGERIVITSAPDPQELAMVQRILALLAQPVVDFSGQLTLKQLAALISRARLFIGMDSVPMHMAAALQVPTVALFGPSGDKEWGPWQVRHEIVVSDQSCRPCGLDGCGGGKVSECMTDITADRVYTAVMALRAHE